VRSNVQQNQLTNILHNWPKNFYHRQSWLILSFSLNLMPHLSSSLYLSSFNDMSSLSFPHVVIPTPHSLLPSLSLSGDKRPFSLPSVLSVNTSPCLSYEMDPSHSHPISPTPCVTTAPPSPVTSTPWSLHSRSLTYCHCRPSIKPSTRPHFLSLFGSHALRINKKTDKNKYSHVGFRD
jgi:hypothetical protein